MVKQREWCVLGRGRRMSWRSVRESEKRMIEQGGVSVVANLRLFLMAKSSALRIEAEAGSWRKAKEWALSTKGVWA